MNIEPLFQTLDNGLKYIAVPIDDYDSRMFILDKIRTDDTDDITDFTKFIRLLDKLFR